TDRSSGGDVVAVQRAQSYRLAQQPIDVLCPTRLAQIGGRRGGRLFAPDAAARFERGDRLLHVVVAVTELVDHGGIPSWPGGKRQFSPRGNRHAIDDLR